LYRSLILVAILSNGTTGQKQLQCWYGGGSFDILWPEYHFAYAPLDIPSSDKHVPATYSCDLTAKTYATSMMFYGVDQLPFFPSDIFRELPALNALGLEGTLTTIKNGLFSSHHDRIKYLLFTFGITYIESEAFQGLTNLKWLRVGKQVEHLDPNLFKTNLKLEYIDFSKNKISSVDRNLFKNLNYLKIVDFSGNPGVDVKLGCETCRITQSQLHGVFRVLETTTLSTTTTTTTTSTMPPTTTTTAPVPTCCEDLRENVTAIVNELDKFHTKFDEIMKYLKKIEKSVSEDDA
jgi:hypothetical protein